jgi:hypothetical protein
MVATAVFEELHCVELVTSCAVPLCNCAMARKGWVSPRGRLGALGKMERDTGVNVPGVLLIVHPNMSKQTSTSEQHAHLQ